MPTKSDTLETREILFGAKQNKSPKSYVRAKTQEQLLGPDFIRSYHKHGNKGSINFIACFAAVKIEKLVVFLKSPKTTVPLQQHAVTSTQPLGPSKSTSYSAFLGREGGLAPALTPIP